jgi:tetratricopeptide (TPR) repeat protein
MAKRKRSKDAPRQPVAVPARAPKNYFANKPWLLVLGLIVVTAAVFWPVRHFEFVNYDDDLYIYANPPVQAGLTASSLAWAFTTAQPAYWHPLSRISHMLDCQLFGLDAGAHHLVNVLFHIANTLLLFHILRRMTAALWPSAFVAALFALHPLHVESVAWITERKDVLSACFWMLTLLAYVRYVEQPSRQRYLLALGVYALGLMAKPTVVSLPFVLLLLDYWPLGRTRWIKSAAADHAKAPLGQLLKEKLPFVCLSVASGLLTYWGQKVGGVVNSLEKIPLQFRVGNAVVAYVRYIGKTLWPADLAVFYPYRSWSPWAVLGACAVLALVSYAVFRRAKREPHFVVGWLWFLGTLVPMIGLVQTGAQSMADRYSYLSAIGLFIMLAWAVPPRLLERRTQGILIAAGVAALAACVAVSSVQIRHWKTSETLFRHALSVTTDNAVAHSNLGAALYQSGKIEEAIRHYKAALLILPDYVEARNSLASALIDEGRDEEAIAHAKRALQIKPDDARAQRQLAVVLAKRSRLPEAIQHFREVVRLEPDNPSGHYDLAVALEMQRQYAEAIAGYRRALDHNAHYGDAANNLAWLLATCPEAERRDGTEALRWATIAFQISSAENINVLDTLAAAHAESGNFGEATNLAQRAVQLASNRGETNLAAEIRARLALYLTRKPYHAPP